MGLAVEGPSEKLSVGLQFAQLQVVTASHGSSKYPELPKAFNSGICFKLLKEPLIEPICCKHRSFMRALGIIPKHVDLLGGALTSAAVLMNVQAEHIEVS